MDWALSPEPVIRFGIFLGVFAAMAFWETRAPRRRRRLPRGTRWAANLALVSLDTALLRLLFPGAAVGAAALAARQTWGLLPLLDLPLWVQGALGVLALDLAVYLQHLVFHAAPSLWSSRSSRRRSDSSHLNGRRRLRPSPARPALPSPTARPSRAAR